MLQVAGRKLLAGDNTQDEPSYGDLFLQSYSSCEYYPYSSSLLAIPRMWAHRASSRVSEALQPMN